MKKTPIFELQKFKKLKMKTKRKTLETLLKIKTQFKSSATLKL